MPSAEVMAEIFFTSGRSVMSAYPGAGAVGIECALMGSTERGPCVECVGELRGAGLGCKPRGLIEDRLEVWCLWRCRAEAVGGWRGSRGRCPRQVGA